MYRGKVRPVTPRSSQSRSWFSIVARKLRHSLGQWRHFQVGHRHHYTIEHLLAFRDYCARTTSARVWLVCLLSLVPAFVLAMLVECIPLRSPAEGWKANYAYWIRLFVSSVPSTLGSNFIVKEGIDPGAVSNFRVIIASICGNICNTALLIGVAAMSTFPVPYGAVLTVVPYAIINTLFIILAIGLNKLAKSPRLRHQMWAQICAFTALGVMQVIYSAFGFVFNQLTDVEQTAFVFVLPVIKFVVKQCVAKAYKHYRECVGPIIVFSVDLCHVLYVISCMRTANSVLTTLLMIGTDAFFVVLALHSIYAQSSATRIHPLELTYESNVDYLVELTRFVQKAFRSASGPEPQQIRVAARFPLPLSNDSTQFIKELLRSRQRQLKFYSDSHTSVTPTREFLVNQLVSLSGECVVEGAIESSTLNLKSQPGSDVPNGPGRYQLFRFNSSRLSTKTSTVKSSSIRSGSHISNSRNLFFPLRIASSPTAVRFSRHEYITQEVQDALQAIFHSEYVLMIEYVECAVPMLYTLYLAVLYYLPTAAYYPQTSSMNSDQLTRTQISVLCYVLLELASFAVLHILLKRRFGFTPLYQLAFVLETQVSTVQSFAFIYVLSILEMNLVHNGADIVTPSQ